MLWFRQRVLRLRTSADGRTERGATAVEYGLIVALCVVGLFGAITLLRTSLNNSYTSSEVRVGSPQSYVAPPSLASFAGATCTGGGQVLTNMGTCALGTTYCPTIGRAYDSGTGTCVTCAAPNTVNPATGLCTSAQTLCNAQPTKWWSGTGCVTRVTCKGAQTWNSTNNSCTQPTCTNPNILDPAAGVCTAGIAYCAATGQPYSTSTATCGTACSNPQVINTSTGQCVTGTTYCTSQSKWYNSGSATCDAIPSCTDPAQPYDNTTNTCTATSTNCAAANPTRYLSGGSCLLATAPSSPTSVSAARGDGQVVLTWLAPTDTGGVAITGYLVECKADSASTWTSYGTVTTLSKTVTGLTNGTAYTCRVTAQNSVGASTPASSASFTPKAVYSGTKPNSRYPASGYTTRADNSGTYSMATIVGSSIPNITYSIGSTLPSGVTFNSATAAFRFRNWNNADTAITVNWTIAETSTTQGASGTFTLYVT